MNGAQGFIQTSGPGSPREGGRGPAIPPPPVGQGPYSRPHSRVDPDSLHMPIPRKSYSPSQWSRGHEDDMPLAVRRDRSQRYPRTASPRMSELRPQYHDARGSRHTLTVLDGNSTIRVVQIEMCRRDEDGSPVQRPWEHAKIFELHVTNDAAMRKVEQLEQHTLPVLDKLKEELSSLMQEKLEYARRYLEDKEEDPYSFSHELIQFETNFQKVDRSLRDSREELHEDWSRSDRKRNRSKDRKRQKSKTTSKGHKKSKSDKDRGRSSSSKSKHVIALVSITAYFKRTLLPEECPPQSFRESEASREDDEMRRYRRPAEYHQRDRRSPESGRDSRHFSDYDDMHSPSQYAPRSGVGQERYPTRDHHNYDARYQTQAGMGQHERPVVNHQQQQQYDMNQQHPQNQAHQQPNMGQQQGTGMSQQRPQQQQHNMHQQPQPQAGMGQQRPQQQGQNHTGPQDCNHQDHHGLAAAYQQRQAPVAPQGHAGMMPQQQPVINQQRQQPQPQPQPQPQMPQQRQPAQPGMAPQQQPQQPAAQHKPQGQPNIAQPQQQQQQQQPGLNLQKQQAQPGMAQNPQHNQAVKPQQPQPAVLHQHGHLPQGQGGHPGGPQNQQQKAQVIPAQVAAQMKDQQGQKGMGRDKGPLPPPPHVPPLHIPTPVSLNKDSKHQGDRNGKGSSGKRHGHPGSPHISEESVSDYDGGWSDSASDISTPATSTSGGSHHKVKKSSRRYSEEHFGIPTRHHGKSRKFAREASPHSPRRAYTEDQRYARRAPSPSPRRYYDDEPRYTYESTHSPRSSHRKGPEYMRRTSPSPRRARDDSNKYSRHEGYAPRIIQSVRRMTPDEVGREILDGDQPWRRSGHNRPPLGGDRGKDRAGRPYEKDNFVDKIRRFTEGVPHESSDRYEGRYERGEPRSRYISSRDYSPSPERPTGRRPTYATRGRD